MIKNRSPKSHASVPLSNQWFNIVTTQYLLTECTGKKGMEYRHM
jgi:hypothetical protein